MSLALIIVVFAASFAVNFLNARYIKYVAEKKMLRAAVYSELVVVATSVVTINYIHNLFYLIPMIIGGFAGTLLSNVEK